MQDELAPARAGALTGAIIGAACRPAIVGLFWIRSDQKLMTLQVSVVLLLVSSVIGLVLGMLVGWVAGSIRRLWFSLLAGAFLGAMGALVSSVATLCCLCGVTDGRNIPLGQYWLAMCTAGAFSAACAGLVGNRIRVKQAAEKVADPVDEPLQREAEGTAPGRSE